MYNDAVKKLYETFSRSMCNDFTDIHKQWKRIYRNSGSLTFLGTYTFFPTYPFYPVFNPVPCNATYDTYARLFDHSRRISGEELGRKKSIRFSTVITYLWWESRKLGVGVSTESRGRSNRNELKRRREERRD